MRIHRAACVLAFVALPVAATIPQTIFEQGSSRHPPLFPLLTWLRDSAVELVFGHHPKQTTGPSSEIPIPSPKQYTDEVVLRFNVTSYQQEEAIADAAGRLFLDVWAVTRDFVDIRVQKDKIRPLLSLLPEPLHEAYKTLIPDVGAMAHGTFPSSPFNIHQASPEKSEGDLRNLAADTDNVFFRDYRPLSVITQWMRLTEGMFPSIARVISIGTSYEGRDIPALRLGIRRSDESSRARKTLVIAGGLHAREWISTTTVNYVAWSFVTSYGTEPMITKFLEHFDVVFIPALNPDGVDYTWQVDRLWRKSRQQTGMRFCRGLDLDHAFGFEWDSSGVSHDPCSESYGGSEPWESVEARALADWARNETRNGNVRFVGLVDLHSYSQQVLFPFAYTCHVDPPNLENLEELAVGLAKAIRLSSGESYSVTSACEGAVFSKDSKMTHRGIDSGGGSAIDWFYHELGAHFSYQIKLRDTGSYGFLLPKEHIVPTGQEIFHAMKYLGDYLLGNNGIEGADHEHPAEDTPNVHSSSTDLRRVKHRR
ncbi:ECM14 protein [Plectosphaerella cucumerina]|uniref:Inactive metallocarboxypeptidase ECM14 n=1 Tax=Plectosphaerella cucumerina TaxID=40658 RepID=A0A8K0TE54_9PEZI|nr:ECM14 protein [Plectosphaerella cucumerina]